MFLLTTIHNCIGSKDTATSCLGSLHFSQPSSLRHGSKVGSLLSNIKSVSIRVVIIVAPVDVIVTPVAIIVSLST